MEELFESEAAAVRWLETTESIVTWSIHDKKTEVVRKPKAIVMMVAKHDPSFVRYLCTTEDIPNVLVMDRRKPNE